MKITKHILAACILTGMAACDTDKEIAVFNEDSGAIKINAVGIVHRSTFLPFTSSCCFGIKSANTPPPMKIQISNHQ